MPGAEGEAVHAAGNYRYSTRSNETGYHVLPQLRDGGLSHQQRTGVGGRLATVEPRYHFPTEVRIVAARPDRVD